MKLASAIKIARKVLAEHEAKQPLDLYLSVCGERQTGTDTSQNGLTVRLREETKINTPPHNHHVPSDLASPLILTDNIKHKRRHKKKYLTN